MQNETDIHIMNHFRKLTITALLALSIAGSITPAFARKVNEYEGQHRKVNEYEGQHRIADEGDTDEELTRKVNEYEGQHR